jgi:hypothetical protein
MCCYGQVKKILIAWDGIVPKRVNLGEFSENLCLAGHGDFFRVFAMMGIITELPQLKPSLYVMGGY